MFDAPALTPGQLISASIRLDRMLGRGGMGSVWVADHLRLRTKVVVKFVAAEHATNPEILARFEQEAAAAAAAKSPHVVQIHDFGTTDQGLPFIAMELLEGEDLDKRLERDGPIPAPVFADWLAQACRGLARAHAQGVVHRDIKPENIFLCNIDGEVFVKLLDFGVAKAHALAGSFSATRTGAFLGTAYYMSPEQTMGAKNVDHRSDLWSLAVVTYEALTGVRPFESDAIGALVAAITSLPIAPPSSHRPELGAAIDGWMARALARDPTQRFATAREMSETFAAAVQHDGAGPFSSWYPTSPLAPSPNELSKAARTSGSAEHAKPRTGEGLARSAQASTPPAESEVSAGSQRRGPKRMAWPLLAGLVLGVSAVAMVWSQTRTTPATSRAGEATAVGSASQARALEVLPAASVETRSVPSASGAAVRGVTSASLGASDGPTASTSSSASVETSSTKPLAAPGAVSTGRGATKPGLVSAPTRPARAAPEHTAAISPKPPKPPPPKPLPDDDMR